MSEIERAQGTAGAVGGPNSGDATKRSRARGQRPSGLTISRFFTQADVHPFDEVEWELRSAKIANERGEMIFEQPDVEIPKSWSQLATNVVVSKYFRGHVGTPERERSVKQLIGRVVGQDPRVGRAAAATSRRPPTARSSRTSSPSARHAEDGIQQPGLVQPRRRRTRRSRRAPASSTPSTDTMESIMELAKTEAMLFKGGSGAGSNLSKIRSLARAARRRRHRVGPGLVHARLRCLRRRRQVGRQDAARREDGDPERRSPGHPRVHPLQGERREEGRGR